MLQGVVDYNYTQSAFYSVKPVVAVKNSTKQYYCVVSIGFTHLKGHSGTDPHSIHKSMCYNNIIILDPAV